MGEPEMYCEHGVKDGHECVYCGMPPEKDGAEIEADIAAGRVERFDSMPEAIEGLREGEVLREALEKIRDAVWIRNVSKTTIMEFANNLRQIARTATAVQEQK